MTKYSFRWTCGYMGVSYYDVFGDGEPYEVRVRREASDYERSISNYDDAGWQREVVGMIGLLCANRYKAEMAPGVVDAFNAWRQAEYDQHRREIDAQPERYGVVDWDNDPVFKRPAVLRGANWRTGTGWQVIEPIAIAA
jgi:hypothetical protein